MKINVADILAKRAPGKHFPKLVVRYLEHLIHQDEINAALQRYGHLRGYAFLDAILRKQLHCGYTIHEDVPIFRDKHRAPVFVSNHPLGGLDGMILALLLHEHGYDVKIIANDLLMEIEPLRDILIPVNKVGNQKREYATQMRALWESDTPILTFPAGACSRLIDGEVKDLPWKDTFRRKALQYKRDVFPICFDGRNSMHFYRVAQWRRWLHIPVNLEMLLLPDEMFRQRGHHYNVYFSTPVPYNQLA